MSTTTVAASSSGVSFTLSPSRLNQVTPSDVQPTTTRLDLWRWCLRADAVAPCYIRDVLTLRESEKDASKQRDTFWWLGTVPCRCVRFVGILVAAMAYERRTMYTVDDGTGVIQCVHLRPAASQDTRKSRQQASSRTSPTPEEDFPKPHYEIGDILRVAGRVEKWHDTFQIVVNDIELCKANDEPDHWIATARLHETYYTQPFIIPPLPPPPTPQTPIKPVSRTTAFATPSNASTVPTPSTAASTTSSCTHAGGLVRLRHPSRLRSKELISSTFKIYLKHYMDTLSDPSYTMPFSQSQSEDYASTVESPTKRPKRFHTIDDLATPKPKDRRRLPAQAEDETPRPSHRGGKENSAQYSRSRRLKGFTLSYLRRVPELSNMAFRVVYAETKRRDREARRKVKEASRAGTEVKPPPLDAKQNQPDSASRKAKRLYTWAIRELYKEGSIILHDDDALVWEASTAAHDARGVWKARRTNDASVGAAADGTKSSIFSDFIDSNVTGEEGADNGELSEPPAHEESYIPLTSAILAEPVVGAIRSMMMRKPTRRPGAYRNSGAIKTVGPTAEELREYMGSVDARWENVTEYAVVDALQLLKAQGKVYKVGMGRWEVSL